MKKRLDFERIKEEQDTRNEAMNKKIEETMQAEFEIPKVVKAAREEAFAKIRQETAERRKGDSGDSVLPERNKNHKQIRRIYKAAIGLTAAAAAFSTVCITNPAFAANIPLVGSIFAELGNSLGFSGDYSKYAEQLERRKPESENAQETEENNPKVKNADDTTSDAEATDTDAAFSQTVDGTTVTLSEVYCNDEALYLSMLIETEEKFPETGVTLDGTPNINIHNTGMHFSYNPSYNQEETDRINGYLDGKILDDHTYAGVLRVELSETTVDEDGWRRYCDERDQALKERGIDLLNGGYDKLSELLGIEKGQLSDADIDEFLGINCEENLKEITVPDKFEMSLNIHEIAGARPEGHNELPEMPQEFQDEYNAAMAQQGLDSANYENFTEEEKEIEHELFAEMYRKYDEKYPETLEQNNSYEYWSKKGDWTFEFEVEKNTSENVTKEVNLLDEEGDGVLSVTKTPFEIAVKAQDPRAKYFIAVLDAEGNLIDRGKFGGNAYTLAISGHDVSKIHVYACDYYEYMDELKGYYWSEDYEENAKTKTFKQLLEERAILKTEVTFDE